MRYSQYFIPTLKETPSDAEVISHQLMLRAGHDTKTCRRHLQLPAAWAPLDPQGGEHRPGGDGPCRRHRDADAGGAAGRALAGVGALGALRQGTSSFQGPKGRRVLHWTDARRGGHRPGTARSQKLPADADQPLPDPGEIPRRDPAPLRPDARPRVHHEGRLLLRRERGTTADLSYDKMYQAYRRIFERCGLNFRAVEADTGSIGGTSSHEFMVLADSGEDAIVSCSDCQYAANVEKAEARLLRGSRACRTRARWRG